MTEFLFFIALLGPSNFYNLFQQLDKAVVNLYDNLTKAQGKRGDAFIRKKKEGLDLLKEAEKCYQVFISHNPPPQASTLFAARNPSFKCQTILFYIFFSFSPIIYDRTETGNFPTNQRMSFPYCLLPSVFTLSLPYALPLVFWLLFFPGSQ